MHTHYDWHDRRGRGSLPGIAPALIVISVGAFFLLNNLNIFPNVWRYWPAVIIAAGLAKLVDAQHSGARLTGGVMVVAGVVLLADTLGFLNLSWENFWPLVLIGAGVLMLWRRLAPAPAGAPAIPADAHEGALNETAIFGGVERKLTTGDFRGGHVTAMFGGAEIDLRRAGIRGDSAVVDVTSMFGGVEFKIPPNWIVVGSVAAVFGGFSNKNLRPAADTPGVKRLYIKGTAIFGGVGVKN